MNTFDLRSGRGLASRPSGTRSKPGKTGGRAVHRVAVILATPLRFFSRLFFSDLRLEREGRNLVVRLAAKNLDAQCTAPMDKVQAEALPMLTALKALLDSHAKTRRVMRHLAFFERSLATHGLTATAALPIEVLCAAREQFETLVINWSNRDLAALHSKMAVAIIERSRDPFHGPAADGLSNFSNSSRLQVDEASHSMFLELERQYQGLLPERPSQSSRD